MWSALCISYSWSSILEDLAHTCSRTSLATLVSLRPLGLKQSFHVSCILESHFSSQIDTFLIMLEGTFPSSPEAIAELLNGPAATTPEGGVILQPTNRSESQRWYYVCVVPSLVISGSFVALRMYTKIRIIRKTNISDCKNTHIK